jgi:ribosomal-protein-alanine N-acetyltransferase
MVDIVIRPMFRADIPAVTTIEAEVYSHPWPPRVFFDELAMANRTYLVAETSSGIVGYGGLLIVEEDAHITTLAVVEEARGNKLGVRLMLDLVDAALGHSARHLTLEVRLSNTPAQGLYERFGFEPVGRRKNYYVDEDALIMWATDIDTDEYGVLLSGIRASLGGAAV